VITECGSGVHSSVLRSVIGAEWRGNRYGDQGSGRFSSAESNPSGKTASVTAAPLKEDEGTEDDAANHTARNGPCETLFLFSWDPVTI
jgi:hypothetical protein